MTESELQEFLEANKADIQAEVKRRMIEGLVANQRWEISAEISKVVGEFVTTEIVPEVRAYLAGEKGAILEAAKRGAAEISEAMAKHMVEKAAKNIESYSFRKLLAGLFE